MVIRTKLKNLATGSVIDKTFRSQDVLEVASVEKRMATFSYVDGSDYVFFSTVDFEELRLATSCVANGDLMPAELEIATLWWRGALLAAELPNTVELTVVYAEPDAKQSGRGADRLDKLVELCTGASIEVPSFIEAGETILVTVQDRAYAGRAKTNAPSKLPPQRAITAGVSRARKGQK